MNNPKKLIITYTAQEQSSAWQETQFTNKDAKVASYRLKHRSRRIWTRKNLLIMSIANILTFGHYVLIGLIGQKAKEVSATRAIYANVDIDFYNEKGLLAFSSFSCSATTVQPSIGLVNLYRQRV